MKRVITVSFMHSVSNIIIFDCNIKKSFSKNDFGKMVRAKRL